MEEEERKQKYSSGVNIILRLDNLWKDTHNHARRGLFDLWNLDLDRIWLELSRDLEEEEYNDTKKDDETISKGYKSKFDSFDSELKKVGKINDKAPEGFVEPSKKEIENRNKHYEILMAKQTFLARLENKLGKGTTFAEGDESDWE